MRKYLFCILLFFVLFCSCSSREEIYIPAEGVVSFLYEFSEDLLKYVEIKAIRNNDEGNNVIIYDLFTNRDKWTYNIDKIPCKCPVVIEFKRTNVPIKSNEPFTITMKTRVEVVADGTRLAEEHITRKDIKGCELEGLIRDVLSRTYCVRINSKGTIYYLP